MEIRLSSLTVNTASLLADMDAYAAAMAHAKVTPGHAHCLCTSPPRKLVIRSYRERLFLAVWPYDGHNHHYACPYHRDQEEAGSGSVGTMPAVKETPEGFEIATDFQLERVSADRPEGLQDAQSVEGEGTQASRPSRTRMGLLGVIHHLWKESGLNTWGANWTRDWWRVTQALLPVIEQGKLGRKPMTECMYLVPELHPARMQAIEAAWGHFKADLAPGGTTTRLGVILGEAMLMERSRFGFRMTLRHFPPYLYFSEDLRSKLATSFAKAYHRIGSKDGQRVVALCLVELTANGNLTVTDAALMATSKFFIPIDSSYEATLADILVEKKRSFIKPLSVRTGESTLPDFILTDTRPEVVLEVFGINTVEYIDRKIVKKEIYKTQGIPVWTWEPLMSPIPPVLPRASAGSNQSRAAGSSGRATSSQNATMRPGNHQ
jgi:Protein of unknown function (DUF1173)